MRWRELLARAWRVWRTNRRAFPPDCRHCGEFMVRRARRSLGGYQPFGPEWECRWCPDELPPVLPFGGSNIAPPPPAPPKDQDFGIMVRS